VTVELREVSFSYDGEEVLSAVALALEEGAITVVIGPSGSGKSTLVALVAGLLAPAAGRILFAGRDVTGLPPERRDVGVVFQSYALFPHLTVRGNVAFGLTAGRRRLPAREVDERVREMAELLGLAHLLARRPAELSGGEQQRVALARALAPRPALLLLDEPLSALDASLRRQVRADLASLLGRLGTTVLYVTHDQEEAMLLADHLVVLDRGRVVQAGPPLDLYRRPAHPFVASFLGEANLLPLAPPPGGWLLIRPEDLAADEGGEPARVLAARCLGAFDRVALRLPDGTELRAHLPAGTAPAPGAILRVAARRTHYLADLTGARGAGSASCRRRSSRRPPPGCGR
jgi:ABC-type Fe3+/spermidine/putrescine transport system ATPase subunit